MLDNLGLGKIKNKFGMITTQKKLIVYFFIAVIIVFFIFNSIFYKLYSNNIKQIVIKESKSSVAKTSEFTDIILQSLENTAIIVQANLTIQQGLSQVALDTPKNYLMERDMVNTLQSIANNSVGNIASIDLYLNNNEKLLTTDYGILTGFDSEIINYYLKLQQNDDKFITEDYRKKLNFMINRNYEQISLILPYYDLDSGTKVGLLAINLDKYVLKNIIKRDSDSSSIIMDRDNHTIISEFSDIHDGLPQKINEFKSKMDQEKGEISFNLNGQKQILVFNTSEYTGWKFVTVILASTSMQQMNQLRDSILILFLLMNIITAAVLVTLMTGKIFRKVNKLIASMKEVEKGNFDITIQHSDKDEFGFMYTSFNNMTGKIKSLFGELYQQKLLQKDAELKLLQSKVNPHFLYNIFDSMNWLIQLERYEELEPLVDAVSNYYKKSLNVGLPISL
jgi:HAMP domain-containing protein